MTPEEGVRSPEPEIMESFNESFELPLGSLAKQQVLLTTELSRKPSENFYNDKNMHLKYL